MNIFQVLGTYWLCPNTPGKRAQGMIGLYFLASQNLLNLLNLPNLLTQYNLLSHEAVPRFDAAHP